MQFKKFPETDLYESTEFLGEGLNSCVYRGFRKANHHLPRHEVAIKLFKVADEVREFEQRFQKLVTVRSRHCVGLLGWEIIEGQVALVMDYVHGVSLDALVRSASLSSDQKGEILSQLQAALQELHSYGVVHGDLSASNIMIGTDGQLKLIDYGFGQQNISQEIVGSPQYMSPSRWKGNPATLNDDYFSFELIGEDLRANTIQEKLPLRFYKERSQNLQKKLSKTFGTMGLSSLEIKNQLAQIVQSIKNERTLPFSIAQTLMMSRSFLKTQFARWFLFDNGRPFLIPLIVSIILHFPTLSSDAFSPDIYDLYGNGGSVEIRTHNWCEIEIDGKPFGYAPLVIQNLRPGVHSLRWKFADRQGLKHIKVFPNSTLTLKELDLF